MSDWQGIEGAYELRLSGGGTASVVICVIWSASKRLSQLKLNKKSTELIWFDYILQITYIATESVPLPNEPS